MVRWMLLTILCDWIGVLTFISGVLMMFSGVVLLLATEGLFWKVYSIVQWVLGVVLVFAEVLGVIE